MQMGIHTHSYPPPSQGCAHTEHTAHHRHFSTYDTFQQPQHITHRQLHELKTWHKRRFTYKQFTSYTHPCTTPHSHLLKCPRCTVPSLSSPFHTPRHPLTFLCTRLAHKHSIFTTLHLFHKPLQPTTSVLPPTAPHLPCNFNKRLPARCAAATVARN